MNTTPDSPPVFVVEPAHRQLLSGDVTFTQRSRRKLWIGLGWLLAAVIAASVIPTQVEYQDPQAGDTSFTLFIAVIAIVLVILGIRALRTMLLYRRLEHGQYLDGKIVKSLAYWHYRRRRGPVFALETTYSFLSPLGTPLEGTVKVDRPDLGKEPRANLKGIKALDLRASDDMQDYAPKAGTPIKVRYTNDRAYLVM